MPKPTKAETRYQQRFEALKRTVSVAPFKKIEWKGHRTYFEYFAPGVGSVVLSPKELAVWDGQSIIFAYTGEETDSLYKSVKKRFNISFAAAHKRKSLRDSQTESGRLKRLDDALGIR